jgi:hypothetical protein
MKKRMLIVLLLIGVGLAGSNITGISNIRTKNSPITPVETKSQEDPAGTINGATNPELIPDRTAYILLFRLISNRQTDQEKGRALAYMRQMGLGKPCCNQDPMKGYSMIGVPGDLKKTNRRYLETNHSLYSGATNHRSAESPCWNYLRVYYTAIRDPYLDAVVLCVRYYRQTYDHPPPGNPCAY